jgi:septum site-determining protein MinC
MSGNSKDSLDQQSQVLELMAGSFKLPLLRLLGTDMGAVAAELSAKATELPQFFHNTPVIIDLQRLSSTDASVEFPLLVGLLRGYGMFPVGVRGGTKAQNESAQMMELPILSEQFIQKRPAQQKTPEVSKPAVKMAATKVITRPVRSGQRVYAPRGDLVVLANVSSGGEVIADNDIHIYGTLRGRAMAGVKGNLQAGVFCQVLYPELVAIAGRYRVYDDIAESLLGNAVHIFLENRTLKFENIAL